MDKITAAILAMAVAALVAAMALSAQSSPRGESYYSESWCRAHDGRSEVHLPSGARADCLTDTHAYEFDWTRKWAEAIGQALHYANETGLRAGIVMLINDDSRNAHLYRLDSTIAGFSLPVDVVVCETDPHLNCK